MCCRQRVGKINERCPLLGNKDVLNFGFFGQWGQHRVVAWPFLHLLQNLPCAVCNLRRLEYGLVLSNKKRIAAYCGEEDFDGHRRIRGRIERLCGRFERVFFRLTLIHHRSNSPDDVDEETHRNRSADSKNDETDLDVPCHLSLPPPAVIRKIVRWHSQARQSGASEKRRRRAFGCLPDY